MNKPSTAPSPQKSVPGKQTFWFWLTQPPGQMNESMMCSRARLLTGCLVLLFVVFVGVDTVFTLTIPGYSIPWYGYVFLATSFFLNQKGFYTLASGLVIVMFPLVIFILVASGSGEHPLVDLFYLIIGLFLGSILLSRRGVLVLGLVDLAEILLMPVVLPQIFPTWASITIPLSMNLIALPLILLALYQRDQLEHERQAELHSTTERLQLALSAASMGTWEWNILTNKVIWSEHVAGVFGLEEGEFDGRYESYLKLVFPEDLAEVQQAIADTLTGRTKDYLIQHRIVWPDGSLNWLEGRGRVYRDGSGNPIRMTGTVIGITAQKQTSEVLQRYTKRLEILREIEGGLLSAESPEAIAEMAAENVRRLAECERVSICLFDFYSRQVSFLAVSSFRPTLIPAGAILPMEHYGLHIIEKHQRGEPYITEDIWLETPGVENEYRFTADQVRAWLCIPLFYHGELIGALNLGSVHPKPFTQEQEEIAQEVANQLAIALHQSRLTSEMTDALLREQRLNKVTQAISRTLDLQVILPTIIRMATELIGAEAGSMGLIAPDGQTLLHPHLWNLPNPQDLEQPIPKGTGVAWRIIESKKGILVQNYRKDPDALPQWLKAGLHGYIEVPLIAGDVCLGTLGLYMLNPEKSFNLRDLALAESIGQQAGIAIQNARLFAQAQQREHELASLLEVTRLVSTTIQLDEVLRLVAINMAQLLQMERCVISTYVEQDAMVQTRAVYSLSGDSFPIPEGERYFLAEYPLTAQTLQTHIPAIVSVSDLDVDIQEAQTLLKQGYVLMLMLSLQIGGRPIGLVELQTKDETHHFTPDEMRLVRALADQAALAIENARLFESTQRQLQELTVLRAVAAAGAAATQEDALLEGVAQIVHEALYPDIFGIGLWDETNAVLRPHPSSRGLPNEIFNATFALNQGVVGTVAAQRKPWRIPDVRREPAFNPYDSGMLSELAVPILAGERLLGILDVESKNVEAFSEADERLLTTLAGQLAAAIERLRAEASLRNNEVRHREMLEKVILLGKAITQITDLQECLYQIHQSIQKGLGFDRIGLFLYDHQNGQIQGTYGTSIAGEMEDTSWFIQSASTDDVWNLVLQEPRGIQIIENYHEVYALPEDSEMHGVGQHITLAAWAGEKPVALIAVDNLITKRHISNEHIEALQLFVGYVGLAIENARWSTELEQRVIERTAQLEAANQELESFSYSVSHDLRAPLRAIDGFSNILNIAYGHRFDIEGQRYLKLIRDNVSRMTQLIDDLLAFSRLGRQPLHKQLTDPVPLIHQVLAELATDLSGREIDIQLGQLPSCQADPSLLRQVFANLIGNAVKYSRPREKAIIRVDWTNDNGETIYFVQDNGVGFDMNYANKLFGVFQRLHSVEAFEGTGIGLAIVHRIVHRHGGRIWATAEVNKGATFFFTVGG